MVGGSLETLIAGTTTRTTTWQDAAMTIANTNPVTLDARGECVLWLDTAVIYKFILKNAQGVVQWTQDNISSPSSLSAEIAMQIQSKIKRVVSDIAALRLLDKNKHTQAITNGYSITGDGGGSEYYYDASDTTSADNAGSIIVASDGGRWKLIPSGVQNPRQHGAVGTGDVATSLQKMFTQGRAWEIPSGVYKFSSTLTADYSDPAFPGLTLPSIRHDISGDSAANTILEYTGTNTAITCIGSGLTIAEGVHSFDRLANFTLYPTGRTLLRNGIVLQRKAYTLIENLDVEGFSTGIFMEGCLTSSVKNVHSRNNKFGFVLGDPTNFSRPNSLNFERVTVLNNAEAGVVANLLGASNHFNGLNVERNGRQGNANDGGFLANIVGDNGIASLTMTAGYFEGNGGVADLVLTNVSAAFVTVILTSVTFNRVSSTIHTTNNIRIGNTGGGRIKLIMIGCGFLSAGSYVPSAARPFIQYDAACEVIDIGCTYSETVSMPLQLSASTTLAGRCNAAATVSTQPAGVSATRDGVGIYTVQRGGGFSSTADGYVAVAICNFTGGSRKVERITQAGNSFQVVITDNAGTLADGDFSWTVTRVRA